MIWKEVVPDLNREKRVDREVIEFERVANHRRRDLPWDDGRVLGLGGVDTQVVPRMAEPLAPTRI